jgi:hypothetical protein
MTEHTAKKMIMALNNLSTQIGMLVDVLLDKEQDKMQEFEDMAEGVPVDKPVDLTRFGLGGQSSPLTKRQDGEIKWVKEGTE